VGILVLSQFLPPLLYDVAITLIARSTCPTA
jgi:hypothetical protein